MESREDAWPIVPPCCRNPNELKHRCILAFTVARGALADKATSFARIEDANTRILFHLFLELCARVSVKVGGAATLAMEQVLDTTGVRTVAYTFFFTVRDWRGQDGDPCEERLKEILANATARASRTRVERSKPWESWHELVALSRIKSRLQRHVKFAPTSASFESGEEWGGERLGAHLIFSVMHAFALRVDGVHENQNIWAREKYLSDGLVRFPEPDYVYLVQDEEVREPRNLYARMLPDWQAQCTPSSAVQFVDALLAPPRDRARRCNHLETTQSVDDGDLDQTGETLRQAMQAGYAEEFGLDIDMHSAHETGSSRPIYAKAHTYDSLRELASDRLACIEDVAQNKARWGSMRDPVNAARRLYDLHQRLGFEVHVAQMRGAFPENISPQTREIMRYAEANIFNSGPLPQHERTYSDLGRFCNREIWRWKRFSDTYLVVSHNIRIMMLIFYASGDAYSYDLTRRVGLNIILYTEEGGTGKSELLKEVLRRIRISLDVVTYKTAKSQAVSSRFGEQAYRMNVMEELSEAFISGRGTGAAGEMARIYKTVLTNPVYQAESLHFDAETGLRTPCKDVSLWIGCWLSACNIKGLLSWVMDPPMIDRHIIEQLDPSAEAVRGIDEKRKESAAEGSDPAFVRERQRVSTIFRKEEFVYAEYRILEREMVVRVTSSDVAAVMFDWLSHHLERAGHQPNARNRDKLCALASDVALLDAVDTVYFDRGGLAAGRPYDVRAQALVERRNWITTAHMVHAIGLAPSLLLDVDERDVRLALCKEFEQMPRNKYRFARAAKEQHRPNPEYDDEDDTSGRDPAYALFSVGRHGFKELAMRLQTRLRNTKKKRILLSQDAIRYRLQEWTRRNTAVGEWTVDSLDQWPTSKGSTHALQPIARMIDLPGGGNAYMIQIGWIHPDSLPEPAETILVSALRSFFAHRHQGNFSAPCGALSSTGDPRIVVFKKPPLDAPELIVPGLRDEPAWRFNCNLDEWGLKKHNARLYIARAPMRRLGMSDPGTDETGEARRCFFSGRPLSDLLPPRSVDEGRAVRELTIDPASGDDDDIRETDCVIVDDDSDPVYHWDLWVGERDAGRYQHVAPSDPLDVARQKRAHNRSEYKLVEPLARLENERIAKRLKDANVPAPSERWSRRERVPRESQKRKWEQIASGKVVSRPVDDES